MTPAAFDQGSLAEPIRGWRPARTDPRRIAYPSARRVAWGMAVFLMTCVVAVVLFPMRPSVDAVYQPASQPAAAPMAAYPTGVSPELPEGEPVYTRAFPMERLLAGRMLLVDAAHPLPRDVVLPSTFGMLKRTSGRVTCRDTRAVLAEDALTALDALFTDARMAHHNTLTVFAGSRSPEQQRTLLTDRMTALSRDMPLEDALLRARAEVPEPGCSEHETGRAVDIRICTGWNDLPSQQPLAMSADGAWLTDNCWCYGFIRRYPDAQTTDEDRAYHFRYVGLAHAALLHASGLTLEAYLTRLHEDGTMVLYGDDGAPRAAAVCVRAGDGDTVFRLPRHAAIEDVSLDNQGWAVASCLFDP